MVKKRQKPDEDMNTGRQCSATSALQRPVPPAARPEPYGDQDPAVRKGDWTQRPDGFDSYRAHADEHAQAKTRKDGGHTEADYQRYGEAPRTGRAQRPRFKSESDR